MIKRVNFSRRKTLKTLGMLGAAGVMSQTRPSRAQGMGRGAADSSMFREQSSGYVAPVGPGC